MIKRNFVETPKFSRSEENETILNPIISCHISDLTDLLQIIDFFVNFAQYPANKSQGETSPDRHTSQYKTTIM